jgi:Protein of unknown function (DUF2971)
MVMLNHLNEMYDAGDQNARVLYKYRSCEPHHINCLRNDTVWFSTQSQLNDPFDCLICLPQSIDSQDIHEVRAHLSSAEPYKLQFSNASEVAEYIGLSQDLPPLIPLGLMASQLQNKRLLKHIQNLRPNDDTWIRKLIIMAREVSEEFLHNITVFCLSEQNANQLMWTHYAAAHSGFCTGYVCPVGIGNPRLIHKVEYVESPRRITPWQLVDDPGSVWSDLTLVKPSQWSYESEWRVTFGNMAGLLDNLLPYREVILGARISSKNESRIRLAVRDRDVRIFRAVIEHSAQEFKIRIEPA